MANASGAYAQLNYVTESVWGTTPGTPSMLKVRFTSESIAGSMESIQSQEIRGDRQVPSVSRGAIDVRGAFNYEFSYGAFDDFLAAALFGAWDTTTKTATSETFQFVAGTKKIEDVDAGLGDFEAGDRIRVAGSASNDGYYTVATVDAGGTYLTLVETPVAEGAKVSGTTFSFVASTDTIADSATNLDVFEAGDTIIVSGTDSNDGTYTVESVEVGGASLVVVEDTLSDEDAGDAVVIVQEIDEITVDCEYIIAGITEKSFTMEKWFTDITKGAVFTGCMVDSWNLDIRPNAMLTGSFGLVGKGQSFTTSALDATPADVATNDPFEGSQSTMVIKEGGSAVALVSSVSLSLSNNLRDIQVLANSGNKADITAGRSVLTGTISALFQDLTMLNKWLNKTSTSLDLIIPDPDGNQYRIYLPNVEYTGSTPQIPGEDEIILDMPFQAIMNTTLGSQILISR